MKTLLVTNYWYPWNTAGTMRWLQLGRYLNFDVLTSKKPRKGFEDETLPTPLGRRVFRHGTNLWAVLSGLYLSLLVIRHRYDLYVFTIPPFTLAIGAFILQAMGKKVILDSRDNLAGRGNRWPRLNKLFWKLAMKIPNRTTSFQFLDPGATRVLSGYCPELKGLHPIGRNWVFVPQRRLSYEEYLKSISVGQINDYRFRMFRRYAASSIVNLYYLGYTGLPGGPHRECVFQPIKSWEESAKQMEGIWQRLTGNQKWD